MKTVVCGGSGFLGSHVADALAEAGHQVVVYDLKPSPFLRAGQEMAVGDILDADRVAAAVRGAAAVYNFAGIADIFQASADPVATVEANVLGTTRLLEACARAGVKRFLFASTLYVYSDRGSFYRASKQACELIIEAYRKARQLDCTVLRYGSLYGPRADDTNWIHSILTAALRERKIVRAGDGEELREYIHVRDAARAAVEALAPEFANRHLVITGQDRLRVRDLLTMIREMFRGEIDIEYVPADYEEHYTVTPYTFRPSPAETLIPRTHIELGQGLLELIYELDEQRKEKQR